MIDLTAIDVLIDPDDAALIRPIFQAQSDEQARARLGDAVDRLRPALPKLAELLAAAEEDLLAFYAFPPAHWTRLRSTNPLERFNREIGRRTDVVAIFPDDRSLIRLVGMLCLEHNDEWLVGRCYLSRAAIEPLLEKRLHHDPTHDTEEPPALQNGLSSHPHRRTEHAPTPRHGT